MAEQTVQITEQDVEKAAAVVGFVRLGLGLTQYGVQEELTPELLQQTFDALKQAVTVSGQEKVPKQLADAANASSFHPPLTAPALNLTETDMVGILNSLPDAANLLVYAAQNPAAVVGSAPAGGAPSANVPAATAAPSPDASVQEAERLLDSFGIKVGKVDGVRDADFDKAVSDLKSLVFAIAPTMQISRGEGLTASDLKLLEKGLSDFAKSPQCDDLQTIRGGGIPASLGLAKGKLLETYLSGATSPADCLKRALELQAMTDPALDLALKKVQPEVLNKLPEILDVIRNNDSRAALVKGLETAYKKPVAAPVVTPSADPAVGQPAPSGAPAEQTPAAGAETTPADPAASSSTTETESAQTATSTVPTERDVQRSIVVLESTMFTEMDKILSGAAGPLEKFGGIKMSELLPVLEQADLDDKASDGTSPEFGVKSQQMAATLIMAMKSFAGIKPPDGTYNEAIGHKLKMAILTSTDPQMEMVRGAFDLQQMDKKEAEAFLAKKEAGKFTAFFNSLDTLHAAGKLDRDGVAKSVNMQNLFMDGLCNFLDKSEWGQKTKAWLKDFFQNSEIGQMIGSVLSMFGINIGRLWGDKNDAAGIENAGKTVGRVFNGYIAEAQNKFPGGQFSLVEGEAVVGEIPDTVSSVMGEVRKNIMNDLDSSPKFQMGMQLIFGSADKETIKNAIDQALIEAGKQATPEAATQVFTQSLVELGKQYQNGQEIDFNKVAALLGEAQGFVETEASTTPGLQDMQLEQKTAPAQSSSDASLAAPPDAGDTPSTVEPSTATESSAKPNALTGTGNTDQSGNIPADVAGNKVDAGDLELRLKYTPDPKDYVQKEIPSNGRVKSILEVVNDNADSMKMSLNMGMIQDKDGNVRDLATKPACAILEELMIRAHAAQQLRGTGKVDPDTLNHKIRTPEDVRMIASFMKESGAGDPDIEKFRTAAESMRADGTFEKAFVNTQQISVLEVRAIAAQVVAARDPNAVKVEPKDAHLYELYKNLNGGENKHCYPLVVMGREEGGKIITIDQDRAANKDIKLDKNGNPEGYKVFVGIVDNNRDTIQTNDQFKVLEVKDFMANGMRIDMDDPSYNALVKNYTWSEGEDKSPFINNYIKKQLCLKEPVASLEQDTAPQVKAEQPAQQQEKTASAGASAGSDGNAAYKRPPVRNYDDLRHRDRLLSDKQARELDGGRLNLDAEYAKLDYSVSGSAAVGSRQQWVVGPQYAEGPFMLTELTNQKDIDTFGGNFIVSRMLDDVLYHSVVDTNKDNVVHPDAYKNSNFFAGSGSIRELADRSLGRGNGKIGFDELLDSNLGGEHRDNMGVPFKHMVMLVQQQGGSYKAENALHEISGMTELYREIENQPYDFRNPAGTPDPEKLAEVEKRERAYEEEFAKRASERLRAEGNLVSANTKEFGNVSGTSESDPIVVASQNFSDMGMTEHSVPEADLGGLAAQQRKSMSYSANVS